MTVQWSPDTCSCIVCFNAGVYESIVQKCKGHELLDNQALLDAITIHNQSFNENAGDLVAGIDDVKLVNLVRIKKEEKYSIDAGNPVKTKSQIHQIVIDEVNNV